MSNIFANKKVYPSNWQVINVRSFTEEELAMVSKAEIISGNYGLCAKCFMVGGGIQYLDLSKCSDGQIGTTVDLKDARILTLERNGATCEKIEF